MSRGSPTTTSYAILGLLAIQPWSSYELTQQMGRSLGRMWPRAQSKLYEEPKKLVVLGLAHAAKERVGQRTRTVYSITAKGRKALSGWLDEPGDGPVLEFEQLLKIFFAENGTRDQALETLAATAAWARARSAESAAVGREYAEGEPRFPERRPQIDLTARFLTDFYAMVGSWAAWASGVVETWPDDVRSAVVDPRITRETVRRARAASGPVPTTGPV